MRWTQPFRPILTACERLVDRALCVLGAAACAQLPEFMQQYLQRLGGHLDEARRQLEQFREAAARAGLSLDAFIAETSARKDPGVARLGTIMADAASRVASLASAERALSGASAWTRPFVFLRDLDPGIARATLARFRPALPTTAEGLVYAAAGMAIALALYHGAVRYPVGRLRARRAARRRDAAAAQPSR